MKNSVISVLVRPRGIRNSFSLGARIQQQNGRGWEVRNQNGNIQILQAGQLLAQRSASNLIGNNWYLYELSLLCTRKKSDVEVRLRVFDEKRERTLVSMCGIRVRPTDASLTRAGHVSLSGPADFAEMYVDPWNSRWVDDETN